MEYSSNMFKILSQKFVSLQWIFLESAFIIHFRDIKIRSENIMNYFKCIQNFR